MAKKKKKNKLGAKAIFARILVVILVTAIGGVASFFGFKTYFASKFKKDKKAEIAKQLKEESKEKVDVGMIQTGNSIVIRIYHNRNQEMIFVPLRQDMILKLTKSGKKAVKETLGINVSKATVADVIKATKEDGALMKKQVENTLGITINSYELLSRKKFVTLINKAGDIKVEFDQAMSYTDSTDKYVTLNEGENSLNGTAVYSLMSETDIFKDSNRLHAKVKIYPLYTKPNYFRLSHTKIQFYSKYLYSNNDRYSHQNNRQPNTQYLKYTRQEDNTALSYNFIKKYR